MERKLKGISIVKGYAQGLVFTYFPENPIVERRAILPSQIEEECKKFQRIKEKLHKNIEWLSFQTEASVKKEVEELLVSHSLIIDDPIIEQDIQNFIKRRRVNVEFAIFQVFEKLIQKFENMQDEYLRQRSYDLIDIRKKLLNATKIHLLPRVLKKDSILVARDILPSDFLEMNFKRIQGIVLEEGGEFSHTAVVARNLNIPTVIQVARLLKSVQAGDEMVVDGFTSEVITSPSRQIKELFFQRKVEYQAARSNLTFISSPSVRTRDGRDFEIAINMDRVKENQILKWRKQVAGIGLFRTEYLFLSSSSSPEEEEQFVVYKKAVAAMGRRGINIRTIDLGGDKVSNLLRESKPMDNPLGVRAIRYSLKHPEEFSRQLRAILRASVYGKTRILFPMVSSMEEVAECLKNLAQAKASLIEKGVDFDQTIEVGIMVEIPSVVYVLEGFINDIDYVSIGTNDLIQYTLAVDRQDHRINDLYRPLHPAILHLIGETTYIAHKYKKKVCLCGEIAGDPYYISVLLGLGIDSFSMSSYAVNVIKNAIVRLKFTDCKELVHKMLGEYHYKKRQRILWNFCRDHLGDLIEKNLLAYRPV